MMDFPPYLFHPIAVHFPIALLMFAALLYVSAPFCKSHGTTARVAADWVFGAGMIALVVAAIGGFIAYYTVPHDDAFHGDMVDHRNWAVGTAVVFVVLALWRLSLAKAARPTGAFFGLMMLAGAVLLGITGFKGGDLVFEHGFGVEGMMTDDGHMQSQDEELIEETDI